MCYKIHENTLYLAVILSIADNSLLMYYDARKCDCECEKQYSNFLPINVKEETLHATLLGSFPIGFCSYVQQPHSAEVSEELKIYEKYLRGTKFIKHYIVKFMSMVIADTNNICTIF